jgi:hypothetical protein
MAALNPLSDSDYQFEIAALNVAKGAARNAHKRFVQAASEAASTETRDLLFDHAAQLTDILSDLNGQRALVREAYRAPLPPRLESA